jgi:hypothetical protein
MGLFSRARGALADLFGAVADVIRGTPDGGADLDGGELGDLDLDGGELGDLDLDGGELGDLDLDGGELGDLDGGPVDDGTIPAIPEDFEWRERRPVPSPESQGVDLYEDEGPILVLPGEDEEGDGGAIEAEPPLGGFPEEPPEEGPEESPEEPPLDQPPGGRGGEPEDSKIRVDFDATVRGRGFQYSADNLYTWAALAAAKVAQSNLALIGATPEITVVGAYGGELTIPSGIVAAGPEAIAAEVIDQLTAQGLSDEEIDEAIAGFWESWADAADFDEYVATS